MPVLASSIHLAVPGATYEDIAKALEHPTSVRSTTNLKEWTKRAAIARVKEYLEEPIPASKPAAKQATKQGAASDKKATSKTKGAPRASRASLAANTVGATINEYRRKGLSTLSIELVGRWFPQFRVGSKLLLNTMINDAQRTQLVELLDVLTAIDKTLKDDLSLLAEWKLPDVEDLLGEDIMSYQGICGHMAQISEKTMLERLANTNSKVPPLFRLCADCLAVRIALLSMVPGAADADSVCSICKDPTFNTGAHGFAKSRADIWENLLSGVLGVGNLPLRLRPEHLDSSDKHVKLVQNKESFDLWVQQYRLSVAISISAYPALGAELKQRMESEITARRAELGLTEEN